MNLRCTWINIELECSPRWVHEGIDFAEKAAKRAKEELRVCPEDHDTGVNPDVPIYYSAFNSLRSQAWTDKQSRHNSYNQLMSGKYI